MRLFPGAGRHPAVGIPSRRTAALLASLALSASVAVPLAYADDNHHLHQKAKHVHGQIKQVSGDLDDVSRSVLTITHRLQAAQTRLTTARRAMVTVQGRLKVVRADQARLNQQLVTAQAQLTRAVAQVTAAQNNVVAQRKATGDTVIRSATQGDPQVSAISAYLTAGSLGDLMVGETGNEVAVGSQLHTLDALQAAEDALRTRQQQVQAARNQVGVRKAAADHTLLTVRALVKRAVAAKRTVEGLVAQTRRDRAAAVRAKRNDLIRLRRLKAHENAIQKQILANLAAGANHHVGNVHGMFTPPVAHSYITSPYGWRIHPIYHYWGLHDGDDFHAPCGVPEVAVGPGKVVSKYYSSVWGNRLYLDLGRVNGHHFVAIYNHISAYRSSVGERVSRGETLALAGTTGWSTACHLHFTLMRDGRAIDPAPYLGF
ncbi:peptidoglycan DD-metalloendopeptidase family protein [Nocardioides montaniterrae]